MNFITRLVPEGNNRNFLCFLEEFSPTLLLKSDIIDIVKRRADEVKHMISDLTAFLRVLRSISVVTEVVFGYLFSISEVILVRILVYWHNDIYTKLFQ